MKDSVKQKLKQKTELKVVEQKIQNASPRLISLVDHLLETIVPLDDTIKEIMQLAEEQGLTPPMLKSLIVARAEAISKNNPEMLKKLNSWFSGVRSLTARKERSDKGVIKQDGEKTEYVVDNTGGLDEGSAAGEPVSEINREAIVAVRLNPKNISVNNLISLLKRGQLIEFDLLEGYLINFRQAS